ncbi:MAG: ATP-dependent DNA ligase [Anaeromyxobacteraceae bacterium]
MRPADAFTPMLARLARELPSGGFLYEPKWDGFRCVATISRGAVDLRSRHGRPFARYFPEIVAALAPLGDAVLDGEIVVAGAGGFDFAALLSRLHPATSRVERLARETPAALVAFDLLAVGAEELASHPLAERRARAEALLDGARAPLVLTPATRDLAVAQRWLDRFVGRGLDGVVAKRLDGAYEPGRRGWVKVKRERTAECVVGGFRLYADAPLVASLLLGLYDGAALVHVGVASSFPDRARAALHDLLAPDAVPLAGHPWERGFNVGPSPVGRLRGSAGRWDPAAMAQDWTAVAPARVCEVAYDQLDAGRFRHPARFVRWRPDREPRSCTFDQLALAPPELPAELLPR